MKNIAQIKLGMQIKKLLNHFYNKKKKSYYKDIKYDFGRMDNIFTLKKNCDYYIEYNWLLYRSVGFRKNITTKWK